VRSVPWKVTIIDTGIDTATGSRLLFLKDLLNDDFMLTYGDGVADVDIELLKQEHIKSNNIVTLTAVKPPARFGALDLAANKVISFQEKPLGEGSWVNGGFFMCTNEVFDFLFEKNCSFEIDTLPKIAAQKKLGAYKHDGFWQPVDTIRDLQRLEEAIGDKKLTWINR
jgi:glucose-1-phosphate cytidylyltransferase